jgi:hypothetical protein
MQGFTEILSIIGQLIPTIGVLFLVYNHFRNPDIKSSSRIDKIETRCPIVHARIDEKITEMYDRWKSIDNILMLLKENDIKHIESEMRRMSDVQTKILTILEIREKERVS